MRSFILALAAATALATASVAQAHVTVHPNQVPAGAFTTLMVNVPNERGNADTTRVDVQLPPGFIFVSTAPVPGWTARIVQRKLAKPVTVFGESHDSEVGRIIWSGGRIASGQFLQFPISVATPDRAGTMLTFKAIQTYSNGEVVRWIGDPGADAPAPRIALAAHDAPVSDVPAGAAPAGSTESAPTGDDGRANLALGLGIAGVTIALIALALVLVRRPRTA